MRGAAENFSAKEIPAERRRSTYQSPFITDC